MGCVKLWDQIGSNLILQIGWLFGQGYKWDKKGGWFFSFFFCSQHVPFKFPMGSHQVLNMFPRFPMCSPRVFLIAPHFNPICFAQSPPLLTYIGGPKGKALHLSIKSSILGNFHSFNFFVWKANQIGSLQKKSWTCEAPLTN
jgi:hypothetical protein